MVGTKPGHYGERGAAVIARRGDNAAGRSAVAHTIEHHELSVESLERAQPEVTMTLQVGNGNRGPEHTLDQSIGGRDLEQRMPVEIERS